MRRADREITNFDELIAVMRGCDVCRLALHDEPYPYILPLNFGLEADGGTFTVRIPARSMTSSPETRMHRSRWTAATASSSTTSTATAP